MSGAATDWALKVRGIRPGTKLVLQLLCAHHNFKTGQCNPSIDLLCESSDLARSTVLGHLAKLEASGFIKRETKALGRARGKSTQFILNMNIMEAVKAPENDNANDDLQVQKPRRLNSKTSSQPELEVQVAGPALIEEPEKNRKHTVRFEDAWKAYNRSPKKARQKKKPAQDAWTRAIKKADPQTILKAIEQEVQDRINPRGWIGSLPDMHRWLRDEGWRDVSFPEEAPASEPARQDWEQWANHLATFGEWLPASVPAPGHPDCKIPKDLLETIPYDLRRAA